MKRISELLTREPLVAFVLLGLLLWGTTAALRPSGAVETIDVRAETLRALIQKQRDLLGRELTRAEVRKIVAGLVDDEILLREAYRRGFNENDDRVRKRLLAVMRSTLDEPVAEPSVAELQAYYRDRLDRFRSPPSVTLEQVAFSWGSEKLPKDTTAFLEEVKRHSDPASLGESALFGAGSSRVSRSELVMRFGPEFADAVLGLPIDEWRGPLESRVGVHYVRVKEQHPPEIAAFEKLESYLRQEWMLEKRREVRQKKVDKLREQYRIELPEGYRPGSGET